MVLFGFVVKPESSHIVTVTIVTVIFDKRSSKLTMQIDYDNDNDKFLSFL